MEQKIKALDSGIIVSEVFVPTPSSSSEFMLGPCFRDGFPPELEPFYPLAEGEKLLLHTLQPGWHKSNTWRSWPTVTEGWINWVDRLEKVKGETWRTVGIYDAIQLSKIEIPCDHNLLYASLCFWSISGNSFHFNFGMMGPTVLDISALIGIRPHGEEISAILDIPNSTLTLPKSEKSKKLSYEEFIKVNTEREDVTEDEHVAFLTMWLCKFLFCNGSLRVTMEYCKLAIAIASGRMIALAPFVLSHLYRGCRNLVTRGFGTAGGPFWILQLWLQTYFPEYRPFPYDSTNCPTFGIALAQGKLKPTSFRESFKFFYSCFSINPSQFTPYSPEWLRFPLHHSSGNGQVLNDIWSSFLIARDLQYGLALGNSSVGKAGVEYYSPNQFARQFGLTQTVPLPPYQSVNSPPLNTIVFDSSTCIHEVDSKFARLKRNFSVVQFHAKPKCTSSFESWWSTYMRNTRTESAEEILDRIIAGEAIKKRRKKDSISRQQKFERKEEYERSSKNARRELVLADINHSPGVPSSSHLSVNRHEKFVTEVVDAAPLSSKYSGEVHNKAKSEVQELLKIPLQELFLPKNYSALVAALTIYAISPGLSVEKARDLEDLRKNLPSLLANFQEAKKQKDEYNKKAAQKVNLVNKLTVDQELHNELKEQLVAIEASISNLKETLKKTEMNKRGIEEQEMKMKTKISSLEAALEELGAEFLETMKDQADSLAIEVETSWADYKEKIADL